jgi:hypothetical protein
MRYERLENASLLVVSPHLDDAWLSCGALLSRTRPVDVLNVFTGRPSPARSTDWDRRCGFPDSDASALARRLEDERAFSGTPHRVRSLDLLIGDYLDGMRASADAEILGDAVAKWARNNDDGVVALPAGAGSRLPVVALHVLGRASRRFRGRTPRHPEHLWVRDSVLNALGRHDAVPLLYEELPYLLSGGAGREVAQVAASRTRRALALTLPVDREEKARRIASYPSQLRAMGLALDNPLQLPPVERYWLLEPADDIRLAPQRPAESA